MSNKVSANPNAGESFWYYVDENGKSKGPIAVSELLELGLDGKILPKTLVAERGAKTWRSFAAAFPPPPILQHEPSEPRWFYADAENRSIGPLPFSELQRLAAAGSIRSETYLFAEGGSIWEKYSEVAPPSSVPSSLPSSTPATKAGPGGCVATLAGVSFLLVGIVLCCTGLGAILGIPLIFAAVIAFQSIGAVKGNCPFCGHEFLAKPPAGNCPSCKNRVIVQNTHFTQAPK